MTDRRLPVAMIALLLALGGCSGPEEGTRFIAGTYSGLLNTSLPLAVEAAIDTVEELAMTVNARQYQTDQTQAKVVARTDQNVRVEIDLYASGDHSTKINIRVGVTGDQGYSHAIYRKIKSKI